MEEKLARTGLVEIHEYAHTGRGLRAVVDIPAGTVIVRDVAVVSKTYPMPDCAAGAGCLCRRRADAHDPVPTAAFEELARAVLADSALRERFRLVGPVGDPVKAAVEVVKANAFDRSDARRRVRQLELFPVLSLLNHSCWPNAATQGQGVAVATADIKAGEEVTINYAMGRVGARCAPSKADRASFRAEASGQSGVAFECRCARCEGTLPHVAKIDRLLDAKTGVWSADDVKALDVAFADLRKSKEGLHAVLFLEKYEPQLVKTNWRLIEARDALIAAYMATDAAKKRSGHPEWFIAYCRSQLNALALVLPPYDLARVEIAQIMTRLGVAGDSEQRILDQFRRVYAAMQNV